MIRPASIALSVFILCAAATAADYGVSALIGKDSNPGNLGSPFKTLTKALSVAKNGDRVFVFPGRYSPSLGESFPISVPAGVKVLGIDGRSCVIDAEFKTNVANPKNPNVNPVQGTVVKLAARCEFARMGIVNTPRNPSNPGAHWWNIALHIDAGNTNADNVHVHHCYLDEFSRGIFVGGPVGGHVFKNVLIDNCVLSRFYVEAINSTVGSGRATGNRLVNCTIVGHRNPANNKPYGRACISFGTNAQFDVRNCVLKDGDWAGLEASTSAKITSDNNCFHGSAGALRGVIKGRRDIEVDPGLLFNPTVKATVDPHHSGPRGPLWDKGTNIITAGSDIDFQSSRLAGPTVDIGADEYTTTDTWFVGQPRIGATLHIGINGTRNNTAFLAVSFGSITPVSIPGFKGKFALDLTRPNLITSLAIDARGFVRQAFPIPNDKLLPGLEVFIQCLDANTLTLSDLDRIMFIR